MSTPDGNKALVRRYFEEAWNGRDLAVLDELFAPDFLNHGFVKGQVPGPKGARRAIEMALSGFPDFRTEVQDIVAEGDRVAVRFTGSGTHGGTFMGIPATGRRISGPAIVIFRVDGEKFVEAWSVTDTLGMLQQLGVMPAPAQAGG